jgi:alpha-tubulin suppressor-like RCC1 family protein
LKGRAVHVAPGNGAVCALMQGGTVECWGSNVHGELGQPEPDYLDHPSPLPVRF